MSCDNTKTSSDIEHVDWSTGTGSGHNYANVRFGSGSSQASQSSGDICRICHCESDPQNPLLTPCYCAGSLKYVHQACLQQWLTASETNSCELCKFPFIMHTKIKPFNEWRSLDISGIERRRLCCSLLFHFAAALCVIWSLCVLIERAADDVKQGLIDWPFWTKLAVVTVGLTGGVVFMYIQCKAYLHLCHRWKARNRILLIQNAPEKVHPLSQPSPVAPHRNRSRGATGTCAHDGRVTSCNTSGLGVLEIGVNVTSGSNAYNYAAASVGGANGGVGSAGNVDLNGPNAMRHHSSSPHHLQGELDLDTLTAHPGLLGQQQTHHQHIMGGPHQHHGPGQVAVAANIECSQSQHNYERDWALDDVVSQISSFRPCPQGSGSMTPFHDSIHNVLEHSEDGCGSSSRGSVNDVCGGSRQDLSTGGISTDTGREHALQLSSFSGSGEQKAPSISSGVSNAVANGLGGFVYKPHTKRYSNSSIFMENRDILNDSVVLGLDSIEDGYSRTAVPSSTGGDVDGDCDDRLERYLGKDLRRYSDTKLLDGDPDAEAHDPMLNVVGGVGGVNSHAHRLRKQQSTITPGTAADTVLDMELPTSPLSPPLAYAAGPSQQPSRQRAPTLRRSLHTVDGGDGNYSHHSGGGGGNGQAGIPADYVAQQQIDKSRLGFKSLPNLSGSCENLLKK